MSYEENLRSLSLNADDSVGFHTGVAGQPGSPVPHGGKQYHFLTLTGAEQVGLATGGDDVVVGILQNKPQQPGAAATVGYEGVSNVIASGAINAGDLLGPNSDGKATVSASGQWMALRPAAGDGVVIPAMKVR